MAQQKVLENKVLEEIRRSKKNVLMREDFAELGSYNQVGRALSKLSAKGSIIRIGYGLYAKAEQSPLSGEIIPVRSLPALAKEALKRLKIEIVPSRIERDYNAGKSTQVPTGRLIAVKKRIKRKIAYKGIHISYEYVP